MEIFFHNFPGPNFFLRRQGPKLGTPRIPKLLPIGWVGRPMTRSNHDPRRSSRFGPPELSNLIFASFQSNLGHFGQFLDKFDGLKVDVRPQDPYRWEMSTCSTHSWKEFETPPLGHCRQPGREKIKMCHFVSQSVELCHFCVKIWHFLSQRSQKY